MTSSRLTIAPHRPADPPPQRKENMSTEELTEQQFAIENAEECLMDIETLEWKMPLDALIEYGVNACFHIFIYDDGIPPKL